MQRSRIVVAPPKVRAAHVEMPGMPEYEQVRITPTRSRSRVPLFLLAGIVALLVLLLAVPVGYGVAYSGRIFRGVHVLSADLSGMSRAEAQAALSKVAAGYPSDSISTISVSGSGHNWTLSPADLGLALDTDKTLDSAMGIGRDGNLLTNAGKQAQALLAGTQVKPILKIDAALVNKAIARIAADVDKPAVDSKLQQAPDGNVLITPSSSGRVLDRNAMSSALASSLGSIPFAPVQIVMKDAAPKITESTLKDATAQVSALTDQPVTLKQGKRTWIISPIELRGMLDLSAPASGSGDPTVTFSNEKLASYLQPVAETIKVEPQDATVVIGKGTVTLQPDQAGTELDMPGTVAMVQKAVVSTDPAARTIELPVKPVAANVHAADVQAVYDKANALVTQGIRLRFRDDGYIMRGSSVTGFLDVARTQGGPGYKLVVDRDVLSNRIAGIAYNVNRSPSDARFRIVNGTPSKIAEAKEGYKVDVSKSLDSALKAIDTYTGGDRLQVDLDVAVTSPNLVDADLSTVNTPDLLGTGQTSYAISSPERAWNVGLGTRNVDGALIPPGGIFSTVDAIGDLTLAAGFKMGYAIMGDGKGGLTTVPAEAGGICQVATTLFHSVFWSGLPVVERNWHSYWIGLYGIKPTGLQGLDATIAPPEKDFRFKNTTGHWILIKATADGKNVTFQLYGVNPGWKVSVSGPVITNHVKTDPSPITDYSNKLPTGKKVLVEHAQDGFNATIVRTVTDSSGNAIDKWTAKSYYAPAHNRYLVGTGN